MSPQEDYKRTLLKLYLENRCSPEQLKEVKDLLRDNQADRILLAQMHEDFDAALKQMAPETDMEGAARRWKNVLQQINTTPELVRWYWRWPAIAAAASLLVLLASGMFYYSVNRKTIAPIASSGSNEAEQIGPAINKALLKLADGSLVALDDAQDGTLARQGSARIIKQGGRVDYKAAGNAAGGEIFNTVITPRGGQYQVVLPDGTRVWLNAASSIRFPTSFKGSERRVEITGEGYFEVATVKMNNGRKMPFVVIAGNTEVKVLGTHFNIMAYQEEAVLKTTLIEGAVNVVRGKDSVLLKPGQQSQLAKNGELSVIHDINTDGELAWRNGYFLFENADIGTVMRQLSRWYDVDVIYQDRVDEHFYAQPSRNARLSDVLEALELTGKVHFTVEGKLIKVAP